MSQINRVPQGLQDLLGSKNFGDNPADLGSIVAPTLDLFTFLAGERLTWETSVGVVNTTGITSQFDVPDGELWLVDSVAMRIQTTGGPAAGDGCDISATVSDPINNNAIPGLSLPLARIGRFDVTSVPTAAEVYNYDFPRLLPLIGNSAIKIRVSNLILTAGQFDTIDQVRFYRLFV